MVYFALPFLALERVQVQRLRGGGAGGDGRRRPGCLGRLACLQRDDVLVERARSEGRADPGDYVGVLLAAVRQQHFDQVFRSFDVAEGLLGRGPECFMDGREGALGAGLVEGLGAFQCSRLGQQGFQVVIQHEVFGTATGQPTMAGDLPSAVIDGHLVAGECDGDLAVDEVDGD
ncbi:hypothetical protein ABZ703_34355 [Streptomyces massasporeus]